MKQTVLVITTALALIAMLPPWRMLREGVAAVAQRVVGAVVLQPAGVAAVQLAGVALRLVAAAVSRLGPRAAGAAHRQ